MSNPFFSGLEGSLWALDGTEWLKVAAVKNWGFSQSQAVLETTTLGDTDRTIVDGVRSLSGSCSLFYYNYETGETGAGRILRQILKPFPGTSGTGATGSRSEKMQFRLAVDKNLSSANTITTSTTRSELWIDAWITSFQMTAAVGEVLSCDVTFEADGAALANTFSDY